jgi:hypothetical protein
VTWVSSPSITSMPPAARVLEHVPGRGHLLGEDEGEAAQRIDRFLDLGERGSMRLGDVLQLGAGVGVPHAVAERDEQFDRGLVMLVLDLADDFLDEVLDGDEAVGARELVDHDGEVRALARMSASTSSAPRACGT